MKQKSMGERLREARGGKTQAMIAEACGVEPATVSMWETDKSTPTLANLLTLCNELNVRTDWLILGRYPIKPDETCDNDAMFMAVDSVLRMIHDSGASLDPKVVTRIILAYYKFLLRSPDGDRAETLRVLVDLATGK